jgi:hypothetical protein
MLRNLIKKLCIWNKKSYQIGTEKLVTNIVSDILYDRINVENIFKKEVRE